MKTYILPLEQKSGLLSDLQSDTIYGHFCWRLKDQLGSEKLTEFILQYANNEPVFTISDGLLKVKDEIRFPRPLIFSKPEIKETKSDKVKEFIERKSKKDRNYLTITELNEFLKSGEVKLLENTNKKDKAKSKMPESFESLYVGSEIDRHTLRSSEGNLFSYKPKYTRDDVNYVILIKIINEAAYENFNCEKIIKDTFTNGFGKKKTSGKGEFEVGEMVELKNLEEPKNSNAFIVLGNYLPSDQDKIVPIGYDINTKYGKLGEELSLSENPFKNPIVFLTAGSCFRTEMDKEYYGRITEPGEVSPLFNFVVQFGMPLSLKMHID